MWRILKMINLPPTFRKNGFDYEILQRKNNIAILKKTRQTAEGLIIGYETIKVLVMNNITTPQGNFYPAHEVIPSNEQFGSSGWDYEHYENALNKFNILIKKEINKKIEEVKNENC